MQSDKKNEDGNILFSLLEEIGKCAYNCRVTTDDILGSLNYYRSL
jgi:3-dehydroquinate synthase